MSFQDSLVRTKETNMTEQDRKLTGRKDSIRSKRSGSNIEGANKKPTAKERNIVAKIATATTGESGDDSIRHTKTEPQIQMINSNRGNPDEKQINIITNRSTRSKSKSKSKTKKNEPARAMTIDDLQQMNYATLNKGVKNQED